MAKIGVRSLILEVTRRCNMCCDHCLRGDAQNLDMEKQTVDALLEQVGSIGTITFSGGEPSLNIPLIRYFFERAREFGVMPYAFYVVTNGKENQMDLATALLEVYPEMEEPEYCGVSLSVDQFHEDLDQFPIVKGLAFYSAQKEHKDFWDEKWILRRGRAYENGLGSADSTKEFCIEDDGQDGIMVEELYVSAEGCIYPDCNLSYEEMRDCYEEVPVENATIYLKGLLDKEAAEVA